MVKSNCALCGCEIVRNGSKPGRFCCLDHRWTWERQQPLPVTKEWLIQKYIAERLDCTQISKLVSRDPSTVHWWLQRYEIPTRPRGYGKPSNMFQKGTKVCAGRRQSEAARQKISESRRGKPVVYKSGRHYLKGKRGADTNNWKGGVTPERQSFYATEEWKQAVKAVWKRDNAICQRCGLDHRTIPVKNRGIFDIHHIETFANKARRCELDNLVLLCEKCHLFVHSRENVNKEFLHVEASV